MSNAISYRPEIDGLRALAVMLVIFFHSGVTFFSGGYVGVDVFFVISGYLITSILIRESNNGSFSITKFYERRFRRILPAFSLVFLFATLLAFFSLHPHEFIEYGKALVFASIFGSNIFFWKTNNYFSPTSEDEYLLHTWSLGVEEQFYILFPYIVFLFFQVFKKHNIFLWAILIAIFFSLSLSYTISENHPSANFYLLPFRVWELMVGSLVGYFLIYYRNYFNSLLSPFFSLFGLLLILFSALYYDAHTVFPGISALLPVVGAGLIILFTSKDDLVGRCLGNKYVVAVGLFSYSLYLWHQPILAFLRVKYYADSFITIGSIPFILFISYLSWRYVEVPLRYMAVTQVRVFFFSALATIFFIIVGLSIIYTSGFPSRLQSEENNFLEVNRDGAEAWNKYDLFSAYRSECNFLDVHSVHLNGVYKVKDSISDDCYLSDKPNSILLWGDSHIQHLFYGLDKNIDNVNINIISTSGCPPSFNEVNIELCKRTSAYVYKKLSDNPVDIVVISQSGGISIANILPVVNKLKNLGVHHVIVIGPVPTWKGSLPDIIVREFWGQRENYTRLPYKYLNQESFEADKKLTEYFKSLQDSFVNYLSVTSILCNDDGCISQFVSESGDIGLSSYDYGHFTPTASNYIADHGLTAMLMKLIAKEK